MTEADIREITEAADELGERLVEALAEETGRDPDEFDLDPDGSEVPDPDN